MKKIALAASLATIAFAITAFVAPKSSTTKTADSFEGIVTYSISVDNEQAASMMQGSSIKVYLKGDKSKTYSDMGMSKTIVFMDKKTPDDPIILIEVMGNKYQLKDDKTKKDDKDPVAKYYDSTKVIAGYKCKKAEFTYPAGKSGESFTSTVYYTEELPAYSGGSGQFKGLKGFPLQYTMKQRGMVFSMVATAVDKQSVSDDTFTVPKGYALMTGEEMSNDIQKKMSGGGN